MAASTEQDDDDDDDEGVGDGPSDEDEAVKDPNDYLDPTQLPQNGPFRRQQQFASLELGAARAALFDVTRNRLDISNCLWEWEELVERSYLEMATEEARDIPMELGTDDPFDFQQRKPLPNDASQSTVQLPPAPWLDAASFWPLTPASLEPHATAHSSAVKLNEVFLALISESKRSVEGKSREKGENGGQFRSRRPARARSAYAPGGPLASSEDSGSMASDSDSDPESDSLSSVSDGPDFSVWPQQFHPFVDYFNRLLQTMIVTYIPLGPPPALDILTLKSMGTLREKGKGGKPNEYAQLGIQGGVGWEEVLSAVKGDGSVPEA